MENGNNELYDRAYQAALRVHYLLDGDDDLSEHAKHAARSVAAQLALVSCPATSSDAFFDDLQDAARFAEELVVYLDFCRDLDRIDAEAVRSLRAEYKDIIESIAQRLRIPDDFWENQGESDF